MKLYFTQMDPPDPEIETRLFEKGWQVQHAPFRQVRFRDPGLRLPFSRFDVLVLSSKNAARWLLQQHSGQNLPPMAVVGKATAALATALGGTLLVEPATNAMELVASMHRVLPCRASVLYLCGTTVTGVVEAGLADFPLTKFEVYETQLIAGAHSVIDPASMVYFQAPSTVEDYRSRQGLRPKWVAAIGPTTSQALMGIGWRVDFQPSRPETRCFAREVPAPKDMGGTRSV